MMRMSYQLHRINVSYDITLQVLVNNPNWTVFKEQGPPEIRKWLFENNIVYSVRIELDNPPEIIFEYLLHNELDAMAFKLAWGNI